MDRCLAKAFIVFVYQLKCILAGVPILKSEFGDLKEFRVLLILWHAGPWDVTHPGCIYLTFFSNQ